MTFNIGELQGTLGIDDSGVDTGLDGVLGKIQDFAAKGGAVAAAAGAAIGAGLALAIAAAFQADTVTRKIQVSLGASEAESAKLGKSAGSLFAKNYGESMDQVAEALISVKKNMTGLGDVSSEVLESITGQVISVSQAFDQDFNDVTRAAGQLMKTGLARNAQDALDIITVGFQSGVDAAGDLLDTFSEYSTVFRSLGLDGKDALGLLSQGLKAGARDADVVADSLKEMLLRIQSGDSAGGIAKLGLNFGALSDAIAKGGESAKTASDLIIDGLRGIQDPAQRSALAVEVFGTKAEDMQQAINGLDVSSAAEGLGNVAGAAKSLDEVVGGSLQGAFESVWRSMSGFATEAGANLMPLLSAAADAFALLFDILRGALDWLGDLPVELYAVGAAVALWASWGTIAAGASALTAAVVGLGVAARGLMASMGPIGLLLAGAATAMAVFSAASDDTEDKIEAQTQKTQALADTLDEATGAITNATRAEVVRQAQADGTLSLLEQLGISTKLYTDASLGNADAQREFAAALDAAGSSSKTTSKLFGDMADDIGKAGISQQELTDALTRGDWSDVTAKMQAYAESVARQSGNASDATAIMDGFNAAMSGAAGPVSDLTSLYGQTELTAQNLATAQADAAQRTTAMGESAQEAYDRILTLATAGGKSADEIQRLGSEAGLSASQIAEIQSKAAAAENGLKPMAQALSEAGSAASELDSLVQFLVISLDRMNGGTISAEQASRANEAALREQAAAVRDVAEAMAEQDAKAQAVAKAVEEFGAGSAEAAAAQRDYEDATDAVADAQDKQFQTSIQARDSALEMASSAYAAAAANGDLEGAAAAATKIIEDQRKKFIDAQPEADRLSGKAQAVAESLYGIPGAVATEISENGATYVQKQANSTSTAVGNIPSYKSTEFDATGNAWSQIGDLAYRIGALPTYKRIAIEVAQTGSTAFGFLGGYTGGRVGRIMGVPGFSEGGQVPGTPPVDPRKDNVLAYAMGQPIMLRSREWVQPQEAVDHYGPNFMRAVQTRAFPKPRGYADGGPISPVGAGPANPVQVDVTLHGDGPLTDAMVQTADVVVDGKFRQVRMAMRRKRSQRI